MPAASRVCWGADVRCQPTSATSSAICSARTAPREPFRFCLSQTLQTVEAFMPPYALMARLIMALMPVNSLPAASVRDGRAANYSPRSSRSDDPSTRST